MKYALITGSTRGIGKAIGLKLIEKGYYVIFNYAKTEKDAGSLKKLLDLKFSHQYSIIKADLSDIESIEPFCNQVTSITKNIEVIVFNAGITDRATFGDMKLNNWHQVMNANINVPVFVLQALYPFLNQNSNILFIGSLLGEVPHSLSLSYGVSKGAVHALTKNLVKFLVSKKIRVNCIAPGFIDTQWQKEKPDWLREKIENKLALKRFGKVDEVVELAWQLFQNSYMNGQVIKIDGGYNYE